MSQDSIDCFLALHLCHGVGSITFNRIYQAFENDICQVFQSSAADFEALEFKQKLISALRKPDWNRVEQARKWAQNNQRQIITLEHKDYPDLLKQLRDRPPLLYCAGDTSLLASPQIAIIGSRHCTPGGANNARDFARFLSKSGLTITSGMAQGIDSHAHRGALDSTGATIAVFGTGLDRIYPSQNQQLAHEILDKGLLVSEFALGTSPKSENFPRRNRIISGLSLATLVIEAARKSGSLITAHKALEQGREVFALPGSIHNPQAKGCHQLIRDGARLVEQASDIIEDIGSLLGFVAEQTELPENDHLKTSDNRNKSEQLDNSYKSLLDIMGYDPISVNSMVINSDLTIDKLSSMLLQLELSDYIQSAPGGCYVRTSKRLS